MNKEKFVSENLEKLMKDKDIKYHFRDSDEKQYELLKESLRTSLQHSYDVYARDYFENRGIGNYASTLLRATGGVLDGMGSYLFWTMGGAGFGLKAIGLGEKLAADYLDSRHYAKHTKNLKLTERLTDDAKISGELIAERAAAYAPLFGGELIDLLRGRSKFDDKVVKRAVQYGKNNFLDYMRRTEEKQPRIISLKELKNPDYIEKERKEAA